MCHPSQTTRALKPALISLFVALGEAPAYVARPQIQGYCIVWCAFLYFTFVVTHSTYPWEAGQFELIREAGYISRVFAHPKTVTNPLLTARWDQCAIIGPIPLGHSGPLCHALSSSLLLLVWTSILHCHSPGVATVTRYCHTPPAL